MFYYGLGPSWIGHGWNIAHSIQTAPCRARVLADNTLQPIQSPFECIRQSSGSMHTLDILHQTKAREDKLKKNSCRHLLFHFCVRPTLVFAVCFGASWSDGERRWRIGVVGGADGSAAIGSDPAVGISSSYHCSGGSFSSFEAGSGVGEAEAEAEGEGALAAWFTSAFTESTIDSTRNWCEDHLVDGRAGNRTWHSCVLFRLQSTDTTIERFSHLNRFQWWG